MLFRSTSRGTVSASSVSAPYGVSISSSGNVVTFSGSYIENGSSKTFSTNVTATAASSTSQYTYSFDSWSNASGTVTGTKTITANFSATTRYYTVTFSRNYTNYGTLSRSSISVPYGSTISTSGNSISIGGYTTYAYSNLGYAFRSWSSTSGTITGARTITANFTTTTVTSSVSFAYAKSVTTNSLSRTGSSVTCNVNISVASCSAGAVIGTIPSGYRPTSQKTVTVKWKECTMDSLDSNATIYINTDGTITSSAASDGGGSDGAGGKWGSASWSWTINMSFSLTWSV